MSDDKPCTTIGELGVHVDYIRVEMRHISDSLKDLHSKLADMPTRSEFAELERKVNEQSAGRTFDQLTVRVAKLAAAVAAVAFLVSVVVDLAAKLR